MNFNYNSDFDSERMHRMAQSYYENGWAKPIYVCNGTVVGGSALYASGCWDELIEVDENTADWIGSLRYMTGCVHKSGKHEHEGFEKIAVQRAPAKTWEHETCRRVAPSWGLFHKARRGEDWMDEYLGELSRREPLAVSQRLGNQAILYCSEEFMGDCHRMLLAQWLCLHLDVFVPELMEEGIRKEHHFWSPVGEFLAHEQPC